MSAIAVTDIERLRNVGPIPVGAGALARELVEVAEDWNADLIVAGNSAKSLQMRSVFGETALKLMRESHLPLFLSQ